jgi:hypothetical protein
MNNSHIIFFVSSKCFVMVSASVSAIAFCVSLFFVLSYTLMLPLFSAYLICQLLSIGLHLHMYMPTSLPVWQGGVGTELLVGQVQQSKAVPNYSTNYSILTLVSAAPHLCLMCHIIWPHSVRPTAMLVLVRNRSQSNILPQNEPNS